MRQGRPGHNFLIYLASGSPRRRDLLKAAGANFKVVSSAHRERILKTLSPRVNAERNGWGKCLKAALPAGCSSGLVLGADTLIDLDGRVIGKPKSRAQARRFLAAFSGRKHRVITGVALRDLATGKGRVFSVISEVKFKKWNRERIEAYLDLGTYADKAGAYAFQDGRHSPVSRVRGSKSNVVGLPVEQTLAEITKLLAAQTA